MKIDKALIERVARNARLELGESEIKEFLPQLKEILGYFSEIEKAPTANLPPTFHPIEIKNITREDVTEKGLTQQEALQNTKHKQDGYFKGPKTI
ncbi:Asp-tRNA(Asn)/Glu-tRNA(Gln) amidotransferase subunit GatC [Candidatus Woesearchaeota archaeon]|nr:Asp-tRNA(Asn)/Glu-tRNA(Gln) amidotransferase subunit GatC [Candidatus Woesearchaeota archaeon]